MRGAEQLVQALAAAGVEYVFGLPGSTETAILDALAAGVSFRYLLTLHESVAVGMADGYARGSGRPGIASLHTSVGTANALSALYNAWRDSSPVVVTAGHKDTRIHNRDGFCTLPDLAGLPRSFTKWSAESRAASQIAADLQRAMKIAATPPCGPTYLALPEDLLAAEVEASDLPHSGARPWAPPAGVRCDRAALLEAAQLLAQATRPILLAGDEIDARGAWAEAVHLAERLGLPVLQEPRHSAARVNFPQDHPLYAGAYTPEHPLVREADLLLAVGCRLFVEFSYVPAPELPAGAQLIHVHRNPWELSKLYPADLAIVSDPDLFLADLSSWFEEHPLPGIERRRAGGRARVEAHRAAAPPQRSVTAPDTLPVPVAYLVEEMGRVLPASAVIVDEGVRSSPPLLSRYTFRMPGSYHRSSGGGLGWGLPAALGVKLAQPDRPVIAYLGDGSALFSLQALWTAARYRIPVVVVICQNQGYQAVKAALDDYRGLAALRGVFPGSGIDAPVVDFVRLAEGYGVPARRVEHPGELGDRLREGLKAEGPTLIEIPLSPVVAEDRFAEGRIEPERGGAGRSRTGARGGMR